MSVELPLVLVGILLIVTNVFGVALFWRYTRRQPIRGRFPVLVLVALICNVMYFIYLVLRLSEAFREYRDVECYLYFGMSNWVIGNIASVHVIRMWKLFFLIKGAKLKAEIDRSDRDTMSLVAAMTQTSRKTRFCCMTIDFLDLSWICNSFISKVLSLMLLCQLAVSILSVVLGKLGLACEAVNSSFGVFYGMVYVAFIILFMYLAYHLTNLKDELQIKTELLGVGISFLLFVPPGAVIIGATENVEAAILLFYMFGIMHMFFSLFRPLWFVRRRTVEKKRSMTHDSGFLTLKNILDNPECFEYLRSYVEMEFSQENPLFYRDVERYRTLGGIERVAFALKIRNKYLLDTSDFRINVSASALTKVEEHFGVFLDHPELSEEINATQRLSRTTRLSIEMDIETNLFDAAQAEIFHLMDADSYVRFMDTKYYRSALQAFQKGNIAMTKNGRYEESDDKGELQFV